jgi:hypothetical protein
MVEEEEAVEEVEEGPHLVEGSALDAQALVARFHGQAHV